MGENLHIVCPHCNAVNRIPATRLGQGPKCGKCHGPLFLGHPVELDGPGFEKHVGRNEIPVLVDFWAEWCAPCKIMAPEFARAAQQLEPRVRLAKLNTEHERMIAGQYGIRSIPTMVLFRGGREIARQAGAMGVQDILRWVQAHL